MQQTARYLNEDQISLYECWWLPDGTPKAVVIVVHGYGEHIGRYRPVAEYLTGRGYAVGGFDLRGHGQSAEQRSYIESYAASVQDVMGFIERTTERFGAGLKRFLIAHSMGGAISTMLLIKHPDALSGAVLSGAGIRIVVPANPLLTAASGLLSRTLPRLHTVVPSLVELTHDDEIMQANLADPLGLLKTRITARTGYELISHADYFDAHMPSITTPLLILHGGADTVTDPAGSMALYEVAASSDKTLKIFDGMYHELHNEIIRDEWMTLIGDWIDARL